VSSFSQNNDFRRFFGLQRWREHWELQPLVVIMVVTSVAVPIWCVRQLYVTYNIMRDNEHLCEYYRDKQYKLFNISGVDYRKAGQHIPKYWESDSQMPAEGAAIENASKSSKTK